MRKVLLYVVIIIITFCVILYIRNPQLLKDIWLWIVGLFGVIVSYAESLWKSFRARFAPQPATVNASSVRTAEPVAGRPQSRANGKPTDLLPVHQPTNEFQKKVESLEHSLAEKDRYIISLESQLASVPKEHAEEEDTFAGTTLNLLRYVDDADTTLGLLYLDQQYFCYTLEDTFRAEKVAGKTRIPAGTYSILFNKALTKLTQKYRAKNYTQGWFTWHLHLQNVPNFTGIYIHAGKNTGWTDGCILVSDDLHVEGNKKVLLNSETAYERLYKRLARDLDAQIPVRIRIQDEHWYKNQIVTPITT